MIREQPPSFFHRLARWWLVIGLVVLAFAVGLAVAHYGYDVPMYDKNTGQALSPTAVALILTVLGVGGLLFAIMAALILRSLRPPSANGS